MDTMNGNQIVRKDSKNCFVESLNDSFPIGKMHLCFAAYDLARPEGSRQTNAVHIYIAADEFLELCRKLECGELRRMAQMRREKGDRSPLFQTLGGTSSERLAKLKKPRKDGKSLSRVMQLCVGIKTEFLLVADSGAGETTQKGLIVPKFGGEPENHVAVGMVFETLSELLQLTKLHYQAWLTAQYAQGSITTKREKPDLDEGIGLFAM